MTYLNLRLIIKIILTTLLTFSLYLAPATASTDLLNISNTSLSEISSSINIETSTSQLTDKITVDTDIPPRINQDLSTSTDITDPNFNTIRNREVGKSKAKFIVVGLIVVASIVPFVTWRFLKF